MRRIISLLVCVMLVCGLSITSVKAEATGVPFVLTPSVDKLEAGQSFTVSITTVSTDDTPVIGGNMKISYDTSLVERDSTLDSANDLYEKATWREGEDFVVCWVMDEDGTAYTDVLTVGFKVKEGVTAGTADFIFGIDEGGSICYSWDFTDVEDIADFDVTNCSVTIGGSEEPDPDPVFTVTAVDNNTNTVVTVENKGELTGLVYAASYDANNVLVNCAPAQALADGTLTFTGITGNVKVFVWDANNAPLLDAFVTATVQ